MKNLRRATIFTLLAGCLSIAGCEGDRADEERAATRPPAATTGSEDSRISTSVLARYYTSPSVRARDIDVSTNNGVVTLRGSVDNEGTKQQALDLARNVEGVTRVDDQLQVTGTTAAAQQQGATPPPSTASATAAPAEQPAATSGTTPGNPAGAPLPPVAPAEPGSLTDPWITTMIQAKFFQDAAIKTQQIDVETNAGVTTLRGSVATEEQKEQAARLARETEGVTKVVNNLAVGR
jgi:hyperosmotically inducible periplasmic protein